MRTVDIFPNRDNFPAGKDAPEAQNLQIQTYGRRIRIDQTFYEYLIEFLLVFIGSDKLGEDTGFKKIKNYNSRIEYCYPNNIALKRFIFLENSKKENRWIIDEEANKKLNEMLVDNINVDGIKKEEVLDIIKELYNGFTAYSGERGWFAKALLPICEETIFPEAMAKISKRKELDFYDDNGINLDVDTDFEFNEHNFMARGGEVYFIHLMQGFQAISNECSDEEANELKDEIDFRLRIMINSFPQFKKISKWIISIWTTFMKNESGEEMKKINSKCMWISKNYERRSMHTVRELATLLRSDCNSFDKFELLSIAMIIQIFRMMSEAATVIASDKKEVNPLWILHVDGHSNNKIKKMASESYRILEEDMCIAVSKMLDNIDEIKKYRNNKKKDVTKNSLLKDAYNDSHKLLRKLGKEIGFVIPINGDNMRFTVNDSIVKFLVLSLVEPQKKVTLDTFLEKMFINFGIVIGPKQYDEYLLNNKKYEDTSYFKHNLDAFQMLLRKNGFLKELSDATSIVINPYGKVEI